MKKMSYLIIIFISIFLISCISKNSDSKLTLDDYTIYKMHIENSDWYKDLLIKTGRKNIEFRKMFDDELKDIINIENDLLYKSEFDKHLIFSPNEKLILDPYSYGLEIDRSTGEELREVDTALLIHDLENKKSTSIFVIGPSGSIDLVEWIDDSSFITVTSDNENENKSNFTILVYKIENNKILKISGFYGEVTL